MNDRNSRSHFRLEYPQQERPKFRFDHDKIDYLVVDVSELGLRIDCGPKLKPQIDAPVRGKITFRDGKVCEIVGKVLRLIPESNQCVLLLTKGVPLAKMMEEQRILIQKYQLDK